MVGQHSGELGFVFEQGFEVGLGHFGESFVSRCKHGERTFALEGIYQTGGAQRGSQGLEVACAYGGVNDVFGLCRNSYAQCQYGSNQKLFHRDLQSV